MFDQQDMSEVVRSATINVLMKTNGQDQAILKKWLDLGEKCATYKDDCLASATK